MIAKEKAIRMADSIVDATAVPMRNKRQERLKRRYLWAFGDAYVSRCLENSDASELAIRKNRMQWQLGVLVGACLVGFVACMHFEQSLLGVISITFGSMLFRNLSVLYARRHFDAIAT